MLRARGWVGSHARLLQLQYPSSSGAKPTKEVEVTLYLLCPEGQGPMRPKTMIKQALLLDLGSSWVHGCWLPLQSRRIRERSTTGQSK